MAVSIVINVNDAASPALDALEAGLKREQLAAAIGEGEVILFQNHFRNRPANKMGWPSTGFWGAAARSVSYRATPYGPLISVSHVGIRQRLLGGEIHPTGGKKYLTIPARAEAYGRRAGEFNNLQVAFNRHGAFALVEAAATKVALGPKNRKTGERSWNAEVTGGGVYFWLVKSVTQPADPETIPHEQDVFDVARDVVNDIVARAKGGNA